MTFWGILTDRLIFLRPCAPQVPAVSIIAMALVSTQLFTSCGSPMGSVLTEAEGFGVEFVIFYWKNRLDQTSEVKINKNHYLGIKRTV